MYGEEGEQSSMLMIPEEDRFKRWKWSKGFTLNELGMTTVEIKKIENRFNNIKARKLIKVIIKKIDVSISMYY